MRAGSGQSGPSERNGPSERSGASIGIGLQQNGRQVESSLASITLGFHQQGSLAP